MTHVWQIQEAKSRFSELIVEAELGGPQIITKRGIEAAIVLSYKDYRKLLTQQEKLGDYFMKSPLANAGLNLSRKHDPSRPL